MADSIVQVTEGSGKRLHTWNRTVGANSVEDEYVLIGETGVSTYQITSNAVSIATANDHILEIMAGASLNLYVRRIRIFQSALATAATIARFQLMRVTTAGTGGTVATPRIITNTTPGAGATGMTLPTVKGTEGSILDEATAAVMQTLPTAGASLLLADWNVDNLLHVGDYYVAAGIANGLTVKSVTAIAACTVIVVATFAEWSATP